MMPMKVLLPSSAAVAGCGAAAVASHAAARGGHENCAIFNTREAMVDGRIAGLSGDRADLMHIDMECGLRTHSGSVPVTARPGSARSGGGRHNEGLCPGHLEGVVLSNGTSEKRHLCLCTFGHDGAYSPGNAEGEEGCTRAHDEQLRVKVSHGQNICAHPILLGPLVDPFCNAKIENPSKISNRICIVHPQIFATKAGFCTVRIFKTTKSSYTSNLAVRLHGHTDTEEVVGLGSTTTPPPAAAPQRNKQEADWLVNGRLVGLSRGLTRHRHRTLAGTTLPWCWCSSGILASFAGAERSVDRSRGGGGASAAETRRRLGGEKAGSGARESRRRRSRWWWPRGQRREGGPTSPPLSRRPWHDMALSDGAIHDFVAYLDEDKDGFLSEAEFVQVQALWGHNATAADGGGGAPAHGAAGVLAGCSSSRPPSLLAPAP